MITRVEKDLSEGHNRYDGLVRIAIDETSYKKGHKYLTLILNHDTNAVVWIGKGYGEAVLAVFCGADTGAVGNDPVCVRRWGPLDQGHGTNVLLRCDLLH